MELEQTADGSYTLYVPQLNEHYHSVKGALTESQHIFIEMGLKHSSVSEPHILEIGFGTGLNAFLTLLNTEETHRKVHYTGIERYPLAEEMLRRLNYPGIIGKGHEAEYYALHRARWEEDADISPWFTLHKVERDFTQLFSPATDHRAETHAGLPSHRHAEHCCEKLGNGYDIIYFDAFAPEKQPEMWEQRLFDSLYNTLNERGILTTYCAKGIVRRMLQTAGFTVERLPGPPGGKREILRASK